MGRGGERGEEKSGERRGAGKGGREWGEEEGTGWHTSTAPCSSPSHFTFLTVIALDTAIAVSAHGSRYGDRCSAQTTVSVSPVSGSFDKQDVFIVVIT